MRDGPQTAANVVDSQQPNNKERECEGVDTKRRGSWLTGNLNPSRQGAGLTMEKMEDDEVATATALLQRQQVGIAILFNNLRDVDPRHPDAHHSHQAHVGGAVSPIQPSATGQTVAFFVKIAGVPANRYRR